MTNDKQLDSQLATQSISELRWKCRRGMRELDLLFEDFLDNHYQQASSATQKSFRDLLDEQDPIINDYLFGNVTPTDAGCGNIVNTMLGFITNKN